MTLSKAQKFSEQIFILLDKKDYKTASIKIKSQFEAFNISKRKNYSMLSSIAGSYIDLGSESINKVYIKKGLGLLNFYQEKLIKAISAIHFHYMVANGHSALYSIKLATTRYQLPKPKDVKETYFEAKSSYLRAFNSIDFENLDELSIMILTNLANNLNNTGRVVEALQYYDLVLKYKPGFPNALHSKGEALVFLIKYTKFQKNPSIYSTIYSLYNDFEKTKSSPGHILQSALTNKNAAKKVLEKLGYSESDMKKEYDHSLSEYEKHSPKIKFFIDNFLSLSEHALYCRCKVSADDDLTIGFNSQTTTDKKLLKLEMYLNRMKSEFSLARNLYYEFHTTSETENLLYLDLKADVIDGVDMEKLRTSFRLCFGILDKIAHGICYLLDIPKLNQKDFIYFHSFWFKDNADEQRKNILNSKNNVYLTSLFCIASDLYYKDGVLAFYKVWRNELEHGSLLVSKSGKDPYKILDNKLFPIKTSPKDFEDKTKKVLQLTRAAIFSFAYCVREELFTAETFNK